MIYAIVVIISQYINGSNQLLYTVNVHNVIYQLYLNKNKMSFAVTWMDLEIIILSEVSQTEKDKYHMISLICGI